MNTQSIRRAFIRLLLVLSWSSAAVSMNVTVTNATDNVDGDATSISNLKETPGADGSVSLREAIEAANNTMGVDRIEFDIPGGPPHIVRLTGTDIDITDDLSINGPGSDDLIIDADLLSRIFEIDNVIVLVEISGMTLTGGKTPNLDRRDDDFEGGAIRNKTGNLTLGDLLITKNQAGLDNGGTGGGIYNDGTLTIKNSTISENFTRLTSGGIFNGGTLTINNSIVSRNSGAFGVGGIGNGGKLTITNSTITGNFGEMAGGIGSGGTLTLTNSIVSDNKADFGSGIFNIGTATLTNSTVSGNNVGSHGGGGGIRNSAGTMTIDHCTISGNSADSAGGGVANISNGTLTLTNSTVSSNAVEAGEGGGISNATGSAMTLINSTVARNKASAGGGIANVGSRSRLTLINSLISGNIVESFQGAFESSEIDNGGIVNGTRGGIDANSSNLFGHEGLTNDQAFSGFIPGARDINATSDGAQVPLNAIFDTTLQNNGGDTETHRLVTGSPAIDAALTKCPPANTDQRGINRPQGGFCDIGAFELKAISKSIVCRGVPASIVGTPHDDILHGTPGDDVIVGRKGNDTIRGKGGNDRICGGKGDDLLIGDEGDDKLYGGNGSDELRGKAGDDELFGGNGTDWLRGGRGNDYLEGNRGDDVLGGGLGNNDVCKGDAGLDAAQGCEYLTGVP